MPILLNLYYAGVSFTNYCVHNRSMAMSRRNTLFRKSLDLLLSEGIEAEEAREIVQQAFEEEENRRRPSSHVSTDQCRTTRVNSNPYETSDLPNDICEPVRIRCDSASKFR